MQQRIAISAVAGEYERGFGALSKTAVPDCARHFGSPVWRNPDSAVDCRQFGTSRKQVDIRLEGSRAPILHPSKQSR